MVIYEKKTNNIYDFDVCRIVTSFQAKNEDDQVEFIKMKLNDLEKIENIKLNLLNRIKREYILRKRYLGLILNGLLYEAEKYRQ